MKAGKKAALAGQSGFFGEGVMLLFFCAGNNDLPTHIFGSVEFLGGGFCRFDRVHFHKTKSFGAVIAIANHFRIADLSHCGEVIEEIAFGGVVAQISDVKPGR